MSELDSAEGGISGHRHQVDPGTGLLLGRDVDCPVGRIVAVGENARRWFKLGQTVIVEADRGAFDWGGMRLQRFRVMCDQCNKLAHDLPVFALLTPDGPESAPGRVLGRFERVEVGALGGGYEIALSLPSRSSELYVRPGSGKKFSHLGELFVSWRFHRADTVCASHPSQAMAGTGIRSRGGKGWRPDRGDVLAVRDREKKTA